MQAENLIILISLTILISYISSLVYSLTKIPDVIILSNGAGLGLR